MHGSGAGLLSSLLSDGNIRITEIRSKDEFHEWAAKQDPVIQDWLYENTSNAN